MHERKLMAWVDICMVANSFSDQQMMQPLQEKHVFSPPAEQ